MNEEKFLKKVSEFNMPDILEVKKSCIMQLDKGGKEAHAYRSFAKIAIIAMTVICLFVSPVNSLASNIAQHVIENIKKTNAVESNDLLYRTVDGSSISLEKGEKIDISVANGEEYEDVYISLIGGNKAQKIGSLNDSTSYTYHVEASGEYVVYTEKNHINITDKIKIEHACNTTDDLRLLDP